MLCFDPRVLLFVVLCTIRSTPELKGPDDLILAVGMGASFLDVSVIAPTRNTSESTVSADAVAAAGAGGGGGGKKKKKGKGKSAQGTRRCWLLQVVIRGYCGWWS